MHSKSGSGILVRLSGSLQNLAGYLPRHGPLNSEFDSVKQYVHNLSQKLTAIHSIAVRVNKERQDLSYDLEDAKKSLRIWAKHEPNLSSLLNGIQEAVTSIIVLQNTYFIQNYIKQLQHPLEEYLIYTDAAKEALLRRDSIQIAFESSIEDTNRKKVEKEQLESLETNPNNGIGFKIWKTSSKDKIKRLQNEIPNLDKIVEENHDKMEIANEGMRADLDRWNNEKRSEIKSILNNLAEQHIIYYQQSLNEWEKALSALQTIKNSNEILH